MPNLQNKLGEYEDFWREAINMWGVYQRRADDAMRAYAGQTWTEQERNYLNRQGREALELNRIRQSVNFFDGYFRDNMNSISASPVEGSDQLTADQLSETLLYVYDKGNADQRQAEGAFEAFITGLAIVGIYLDYDQDKVFGDLKFYKKSYNSVVLDPFFECRDLTDCSAAIVRDYLTKDEIKGILPFVDPKEIDDLPTNTRDQKFLLLPERRNFTWYNSELVTYDQYYKRVSRPAKFLVDQMTGESREINPEIHDEEFLKFALGDIDGRFEIVDSTKRTVELNIIVAGNVLYSGPDPTGLDTFPFVPFMGYWHPQLDDYSIKLQGVVQGMIDAQREFNKRHSKYIDIMDKSIATGWFYKPEKMVDVDQLWQTGQLNNIALKPEALWGQDLGPLPGVNLPPGLLEYQKVLDNLIPELSGVNQDMLGTSEGGNTLVSGTLAEVRASNGLRSNRGIFDNLEFAQRELGKITLQAVQRNYGPEKIKRIINQDPTPQFHDKLFQQYDVQMVQTVKSLNQRHQYYLELLQARQLGLPIPDEEIIKAMPMQDKSELLESMEKEKEFQQQLQQMQMEDKQRQDRLVEAETQEKIALAQERRARMVADIGLARERISEAAENRSQAALARAKTLAEIDKMDTDRLLQVMNFMQQLEMSEAAAQEAVDQEVKATSVAIKNDTEQQVKEESEEQPQGAQTLNPEQQI